MTGWFNAASDSKGGGRYCSAGSSPGYIHIHGICVRSKSCEVASLSNVGEKALRCSPAADCKLTSAEARKVSDVAAHITWSEHSLHLLSTVPFEL
jgi:hypothetical protein